MLIPDRSVPRVARYTWSRQWRADIFAGLVEGLLGVASFMAVKSLGAPWWVAAVFSSFGQILWLAAPAWEAAFARFHIRQAFLWMGLLSNAPLLLVAFVDDAAIEHRWGLVLLAGVVILASAVDAAYLPHRNALSSANYPAAIRGRLFAMLSVLAKVSSGAATMAASWMLDSDFRWLRVVFPLAGIFGLLEHWTMSRIHWHRTGRPKVRRWGGFSSAVSAAADAWRETFRILREDRAFLVYEMGFLLYGAGFLMSVPLVPIFAAHELKLSYIDYAWAQGFAQSAAYCVAILTFGRLLERIGVVRLTAAAFVLLTGYFLWMSCVSTATSYAASFVLFGVAMALVNLGWTLGPMSFAPAGKARSYITVHVLFVGVRSSIAPFAGVWLAPILGITTVFRISACFVALGALTVYGLSRTRR